MYAELDTRTPKVKNKSVSRWNESCLNTISSTLPPPLSTSPTALHRSLLRNTKNESIAGNIASHWWCPSRRGLRIFNRTTKDCIHWQTKNKQKEVKLLISASAHVLLNSPWLCETGKVSLFPGSSSWSSPTRCPTPSDQHLFLSDYLSVFLLTIPGRRRWN